ncbi:MAG: hypothetical protein DRN81_04660 [Thermoproteota archaeon]|nr:MAG: hypothetical protein DRN81_04660 [Candidatus Korarchaeota archaeon]
MKDGIKIKQNVKYQMFDKDGNLTWEFESHNTDCKLHGVLIADHMAGGSDTLISYGHAGTGSGQDAQDTNLATYCAEARTALDSKTQGTGNDANDVVYVFTLGAGVCTGTLTEVGLFIASAQATADMQFYDDSINKVKAAGDTLVVTWTVTYGTSPI